MNSLTDKEINRASDGIDKALSTATRSNRGEVAFRILSVVRNLNDHIAFKIWKDVRPDQKMDINKVASKFGNVRPYQFIARFDHFLRASVSHFTPSEEGAERLMIKYYRYLLQLKKAVYDRYGMIILRNIDMFLEDLDEQTKDYYQKVATEIEKRLRTPPPKNFDNYYIDKIKPFFVNQEIYYEVALEPADEKPNKFNRITAFTKYDISTDYCVALSFSNATISVFNTDFPIKIITEWHVSIRPCELNNFAELLNVECSVSRGLNEYKMVMSYLEQNGATLVDIIDYDQQEYDSIKNWVIASTQKRHSYIFDMLDICREISASKRDGANIIRYLLYRMNNRIIKDQQAHGDEKRYAGLNISSKCMPFDRNPYSFNPKGHISNLYDLFECIDTAGHKGELLSRYIEKNTNQNGVLFTPIDQLTMFGIPQEIEQTIEKYNRSLYSGFRPASELGVFKDYVYSKGCEIATVQIINKLEELADNVPTISSSFSEKMISQLKLLPAGQRLDDEVKEQILKTLFSESAVHLIYGAAGTGKTTLVNHISKLLEGKKKIYMKGRILSIQDSTESVYFTVEIDALLDELEVLCCNGLDYIGNDGGKTQVGFNINRTKPYSSDEERTTMEHIVPFQIAYAVSIHKAQGLEYDSVKIVIADETEDQITHNIFYTAITRAKQHLTIYWSPEVCNRILARIRPVNYKKDFQLLKAKNNL